MPTRDNEHPLISAELEERAQTVATEKKNVLILHNRKHFSNELYCPNCKEILLCPDCQVSYVFDQKTKGIYCPNCQKPLAENRCPHCKQRDYQYKQFGLENLLQYWKSKYPDSQVFNIEQKKYSEKEELALRDSLLNSAPGKIIIATNYIFSLVPKNYFQLIGITQSDQLLNIADFNSHWRLFSQLAQLIQHCAEENIELCLQSWQKQHFVMKALKEYNYPQFYKEELKWRQDFDYPPFQRLVKILYQNEDVKNGEKIVANTWNDLQTRLVAGLPAGFSAADSGINAMPAISGGYQAMHKQLIQTQRNTRWRWLIWFKIEEKAWLKNQNLHDYIKQLDEDFFVDISPENLYR
jgi:primosomal protein N' (replication factor Y)